MTILGFIRRFNRNSNSKLRFERCYIQSRALTNSKLFNDSDSSLPVLIVGAGPVGLVLSILLTKLGVKCSVLEKNTSFSKHPQAHFINNRSMEVFRKLDNLAEEIEKSQPPVDLWRKFIYCTSLYGSVLGSVDHMQPQDFEKVISPVSVAHFSQYKLTSLLLKQLENLKFRFQTPQDVGSLENGPLKGKEILMGHECIAVDASNRCVTATFSFLKEGKHMKRSIDCKMLVGADGAGSTIRKLVGIEMSGETDLQKLVSVHFLSRDLGRYLLVNRPGMLFFVFNTEVIGVLVAHDLEQGEFVLQVPFYPPQQNLDEFSSEICKKLIFKLVGGELSDLKVMGIKPWIMHAEVADKFADYDNRVLLAGDAAHRFPPAGGFGMNTGVQDAHNLAWKIAALLKGTAQASILKTYEAERKPIANFNTALSVQNFKAAMAVPAALGLDPTVANSVHRVVNNTIGSILPSGVQKAILDGVFAVGRQQVSESILNENNPLGYLRLGRLRRIFDEGKSLQLQFPAEDLGFRYLDGALVPDEESEVAEPGAPTGRRRDYIPSADPGSRLPHMNVKVLGNTSHEDVISTLDLISGEKVEFLLIIAPIKDSYRLGHAALKVAEEFQADLKVCIMWPSNVDNGIQPESKLELSPWDNYIDVMEVSMTASWWSICKMTDKGAILVRPDDHVAWRVKSSVVGDPVDEMEKAFTAILGQRKQTSI